jgi:hypothetical protein
LENLIAEHPIVAHLKHHLFHCTSIEGLCGIERDGCIRYNDGAFQPSYPKSAHGYGRRITAISIFDFEGASESEIVNQEILWLSFLSYFDPITAVILLNSNLRENIKIPAAVQAERDRPMYIPYVEAGFHNSIQVDSIEGVLLVYDKNPDNFKVFSRLEEAIEAIPDRVKKIAQNSRSKTPAEPADEN